MRNFSFLYNKLFPILEKETKVLPRQLNNYPVFPSTDLNSPFLIMQIKADLRVNAYYLTTQPCSY